VPVLLASGNPVDGRGALLDDEGGVLVAEGDGVVPVALVAEGDGGVPVALVAEGDGEVPVALVAEGDGDWGREEVDPDPPDGPGWVRRAGRNNTSTKYDDPCHREAGKPLRP